jgi:hypothetical protein
MRRISILVPLAVVGISRAANQPNTTSQRHFGDVRRNILRANSTSDQQSALIVKPEQQVTGRHLLHYCFQFINSRCHDRTDT